MKFMLTVITVSNPVLLKL